METEKRGDSIFYTITDVIGLLCGKPQEKEHENVSSFIFLQKQLAKTMLVDGGKFVLRYFFGTDNKDDLTEDNKEWYDVLVFLCSYHLQYPITVGFDIAKNYFLPYLKSFDIFSESIIRFFTEDIGKEYSITELNNCILSIKDFVKYEESKSLIVKLYDELTEYLYMKSVLEQKQSLDSIFQRLGSLFIDYIDQYSVTSQRSVTEESVTVDTSNELVFTEEGLRKSINILYDELKKRTKIPSGLATLDRNFLRGGFENGRVYVFCARPGHGKSILLLNFAYNSAKHTLSSDEYTVYITLENDLVETMDRLIKIVLGSNEVEPSLKKELLQKDISFFDKNMLDQIVQKCIGNKPLIIKYFPPNTSVSTLFSWLSTLNATHKLKIVFVDYLSLLRSTAGMEAKRFELGQITLDLKKISRHFNIPIVTAAQLNTGGYEGIPSIKNVDESRQIVQHADFVCLLYDPKDVSEALSGGTHFGWSHIVPIGFNVDKNRSGTRGRFILGFDTKFLRFVDDVREERISLFETMSSYNESTTDLVFDIEKSLEEQFEGQFQSLKTTGESLEDESRDEFLL